ncbi:hypothetical protein RMATCC62417_15496 [Rhizopus microsporus]|nr:hypothetical protein RMATCC62417_15496 [Rhizopus microsporus]
MGRGSARSISLTSDVFLSAPSFPFIVPVISIRAMLSILFIQQRSLYDNISPDVLSPQQQQDIRASLLDEIGFQQFFGATDYEKVKAILTEYRDNTKDIIDSRVNLLQPARSKTVPERNVLLAIEAL